MLVRKLSKQKKTDEYEFELPDNWRLAHLESITKNIPSKKYQILESQVLADGRFPVISQSKAYSIGFSNEADKVYHHDRPVIIFGDHTSEVKFVEFDFVVGADGVKIFEPIDDIIVGKFLFYIFQFYYYDFKSDPELQYLIIILDKLIRNMSLWWAGFTKEEIQEYPIL